MVWNPEFYLRYRLISSLEKFYSGNLSQIVAAEVDLKYSNSETTTSVNQTN